MLAKTIFLRWGFAVFLMLSSIISFAQRVVTGKVTGTDNQPASGATVTVTGTNVATQTDANGNFSINVPQGRNSLTISYVGFENQTVAISGRTAVNVSLRAANSALSEVVVTGYTAQRKKDITGSVSVVNVNNMRQQPVGTGEEALQGQASGVTVLTSGQPGAGSDIRIRGITGFGNNAPLIIIDGVRGNLHDINVADVESMQVLKDASAAVYGIAGANGVIIITTKRGRSGKARVSYDGYYGVTTPGPGYKMASTSEEANAIWLQQKNSGIAVPTHSQFGSGANPVIPEYITPAAFTGTVDPTKYDINSFQITKANKEGTNWYKEITRTAPTQSHNLSVSAGSDKSSYFFSLGYLDQQGIARFQYLKRYSVRANTQFSIGDHIRVGENAYIYYRTNPRYGNQGEGSPFSVVFREDAIIPVYDIMGNFAGTKSLGLGNARNPYADIYRTKDNRNNEWDITGNVFAEVDLLRHLTFRTNFGGGINNNYSFNFNYVGYENAEGNTGDNSFGENASYGSNWTYNNTLTYNNTFGNHNVRLLVGTEAVRSYSRFMSATRSKYFSENPTFWVLNAGTGPQANSGGAGHSALWSQFARVEYGFAGKYLLNANLRRDGASVFVGEKRHAVFPSASVAWRISQESFLKNVAWISDLKLRYSYGVLGTPGGATAENAYNLYASRAGRSFYDITGASTNPPVGAGFFRSNIGNPATTFEKDIVSNVGIDATLFKNKIDLSIDWYKKSISGLLFGASGTPYDVVFVGDAGLPLVNIGNMQNTGIDGNITYHGALNRDFKFDLTGTFTSYNNKIVSIPGLPFFYSNSIRNVTVSRNEVGHAVGEFYGYQVEGIFQNDAEVAKAPKQTDAQPGVFRFKDVNGDGKIDADDRTYIGNPNPDFTYGLNISFSYKNFDFSTFFFGSKGNDIYDFTRYYTDFPDFFKGGIRRDVAVNSWTPDNPNSNIPKLRTKGGFSTDLTTNSYFVSKGSFLRNKQMQLGYVVPAKALSRFGIERLRLYIQSTNLFTITKYKGLDPELQSSNISRNVGFGIDQGNYPHTPAFLFGVNLNF